MEIQIGQVKFIYGNGGFSAILVTPDHEIIVNIKPNNVDTAEPVLRLFVMPVAGVPKDGE